MEKYKIDKKRGYESNRRNLDLEGKERQRAKKTIKEGLLEPTKFQIIQDVREAENDRENLINYLEEELGDLLDKELGKDKNEKS